MCVSLFGIMLAPRLISVTVVACPANNRDGRSAACGIPAKSYLDKSFICPPPLLVDWKNNHSEAERARQQSSWPPVSLSPASGQRLGLLRLRATAADQLRQRRRLARALSPPPLDGSKIDYRGSTFGAPPPPSVSASEPPGSEAPCAGPWWRATQVELIDAAMIDSPSRQQRQRQMVRGRSAAPAIDWTRVCHLSRAPISRRRNEQRTQFSL